MTRKRKKALRKNPQGLFPYLPVTVLALIVRGQEGWKANIRANYKRTICWKIIVIYLWTIRQQKNERQ